MSELLRSAALLFALLNPFLMTIYLLDLIRDLDAPTFRRVLLRGALISALVFVGFALTGDLLFRELLQVRFASFQIFGGVIFLLIGIRFVMQGPGAIEQLRGEPEHVAGSIALPFMIGPGTVSASVLAGTRLPPHLAVTAVIVALTATVLGVIVIKNLHDHVRTRNEALVERYVDLVGRVSALLIGTFAIDMILSGLESWKG